jgi:flavodoxin
MESLVVYDSKFGNTKKIAEAIANGLRSHGAVRIFGIDTVLLEELGSVDLLIVGGPTQAHTFTARMRQFVNALKATPDSGMVCATFDTRLRVPAVISGSAAKAIASGMRRAGIRLFVPPQSFFVKGSVPELDEGETERAAAWAKGIADRLTLSQLCAA